MIDAILFDLGDTLFHYEKQSTSTLVEEGLRPLHDRLTQLGYPLPAFRSYLRTMKWNFVRGLVWSRLSRREVKLLEGIHRMHQRMGVEMEFQRTCEHCLKHMKPAVGKYFVAADGATDVLIEFQTAGYKLGIVSNTVMPGSAVDAMLSDHGLIKFFPVRVYSSEVRYMKPDQRIFRMALQRLSTPPGRALFIGDHAVNDIRGAAAVGMRTVLAVHGPRVPRTPVRPDHVIRALAELPPILQSYKT